MSENHTDCERFEALLLDGGPGPDVRAWHDHLEGCAGCREQWEAHQMLVATFAEETVPQLSAARLRSVSRYRLGSRSSPLQSVGRP